MVRNQEIPEIPGFPNVRTWADGTFEEVVSKGMSPKKRPGKPIEFLAISGGGSAGAYGAGILVGLTESGKRPDFDVVSGVSTGALTAPFAFLGSEYDDELTYIYTSGITQKLFQPRPLIAGLLGSGLVGPRPLRKLVEKYADEKLLDAVAAEYRKGRRLIVLTTNMDAQRPVVWDMGRIASSNQPGRLKLFQDVLIASASIPAVLPPVFIDAEVDGKSLKEMHSDGGTAVQVFAIPDGLLASANPSLLKREVKGTDADLYMIVNYTLIPEFQVIKDSTIQVGLRGLSTLMKAQTRNSVIATYGFAKQAGIKFHLATIDKIVPYDPADSFNPEYMRTLFKLGRDRAVARTVWQDSPISALSADPRSGHRASASAGASQTRRPLRPAKSLSRPGT